METTKQAAPAKAWAVAILLVYGLSLALPVLGSPLFRDAHTNHVPPQFRPATEESLFHEVLLGTQVFFLSLFCPVLWFPNLLLWSGIYHLIRQNWSIAGWLGVLAFFFGLTPLVLCDLSWWPPRGPVTWHRLYVGYYTWLTSMLLVALAAIRGNRVDPRVVVSSQLSEDSIYREIANQLVVAMPDGWKYAKMEVTYHQEAEPDCCRHAISNPEFPRDIVEPTDELLQATRSLVLHYKRLGTMWTTMNYELNQQDDDWRFTVNVTH